MIRVPARLYGVLRQHHIDTWSTLLERTAPEVIDWHGVGPLMISRLFGLLMEHSLVGLVKARQPDRTSADLMALLEYEDLQGTVALRAALGDLATGGHPEPVRRSAQRLLQSNHASPVRDTEVLSEVLSGLLEASGSPRDQLVFGGRELTTFDRPSVADLARRLRVSTERIRQMVRRSRERVRIAGAGAPEPAAGPAMSWGTGQRASRGSSRGRRSRSSELRWTRTSGGTTTCTPTRWCAPHGS